MFAGDTGTPLLGSNSVMAGPRTSAYRLPAKPSRAQPRVVPSRTSHCIRVISVRHPPAGARDRSAVIKNSFVLRLHPGSRHRHNRGGNAGGRVPNLVKVRVRKSVQPAGVWLAVPVDVVLGGSHHHRLDPGEIVE